MKRWTGSMAKDALVSVLVGVAAGALLGGVAAMVRVVVGPEGGWIFDEALLGWEEYPVDEVASILPFSWAEWGVVSMCVAATAGMWVSRILDGSADAERG